MYNSDTFQAGATPGIRSVRCGQGAPEWAQLTALVERQGECQVVPIQCTPASYSCRARKNTVLAHSVIARWGEVSCTTTPSNPDL